GAPDIGSLFDRMLGRLEQDHEKERPRLVRDGLSLLASSRQGLAEAELRDLLGDACGPLPAVLLAQFLASFRGCLREQGALVTFFHPALGEAVAGRYLSSLQQASSAHRQIADYFAGRPWSMRKVEELPWQLARLGSWNELLGVLTEPGYLHWAWPTR